MKQIHFLLFLTTLAASLAAQVRIDTLSMVPAGPGTWHIKMHAPLVPWQINVLKVDLTNPYLKVKTVKGLDRLNGFEVVSSMAARKSAPGHEVIGAINGDYWGGTQPIGLQVAGGEVVKHSTSYMVLGFDTTNKPVLFRPMSWSGTIVHKGLQRTLSGVNATRNTDQLILYNSYQGATTGTNVFGAEALVTPLKTWMVNDTVLCVVDTVVSDVGNMAIPAGKAVISGHGFFKAIVAGFAKGDTVRVVNRLLNGLPRMMEAIGGHPRIVVNGQNYVSQGVTEEGGPSHWVTREPRTGVGITQDSTTLYIMVIDGRTPQSAGMTFEEMAAFMMRLGIHTGGVLDGGGSSTMVVRGKIENYPSGGGIERAVSNGLILVSSAPTGALSKIILSPKRTTLFAGDTLRFNLLGIDQYNNPLSIDPTQAIFTARAGLGSFSAGGLFTTGALLDSGWVFAEYNGVKDSCFITTRTHSWLSVTPKNVTTDSIRTVPLTVRVFDQDNIQRGYNTSDLAFTVLDPSVGRVTNGVFKGLANGTTRIVATLKNSIRDTVQIIVDIRQGLAQLAAFESLSGLTPNKTNVDSLWFVRDTDAKTEGEASLRITWSGIPAPSLLKFVQIETSIEVPGIPDTLYLDVRPDSSSYRFFFYAMDDNNEQFKWTQPAISSGYHTWTTAKIPATLFQPTSAGIFNYPIRITRLEFQLFTTRTSGVFNVDNFRITYPRVQTSAQDDRHMPLEYRLEQNYPNPFNPATTIRYALPVRSAATLSIYDVLGREVARLADEVKEAGLHSVRWDARAMPSGIYFSRLKAGNITLTRKLVLAR